MIKWINPKRKLVKTLSVSLAVCFLNQLIFPSVSWALTSGPTQEELKSFEPAGSTEMVNLFTGDFTYNIPLLEVDGYPVNLAYHAGITMEQEASWVGLGWNINPGSMTRNLQGLPDDFMGDEVFQQTHIKNHEMSATKKGKEMELNVPITAIIQGITGIPIEDYLAINLNYGLGLSNTLSHDNYTGMGIDLNFDASRQLTLSLLPSVPGMPGFIQGEGIGLTLSSRTGIGINPSQAYGMMVGGGMGISTNQTSVLKFSAPYSTRSGLKSIDITQAKSFSISAGYGGISATYGQSYSGTTHLNQGSPTYTPYRPNSSLTVGYNRLSRTGEIYAAGLASSYTVQDRFNAVEAVLDDTLVLKAYGYLNNGTTDPSKSLNQLMDYNREGVTSSVPATLPNLPFSKGTPDYFTATGHGIFSSMRPYRSDIGTYYDPIKVDIGNNRTESVKLGIDPSLPSPIGGILAIGGLVAKAIGVLPDMPPELEDALLSGELNIPIEYTEGNGTGTKIGAYGGWFSPVGNKIPGQFMFKEEGTNLKYEPYYFKSQGELTPFQESFFNGFGGESASRFKVNVVKKSELQKSKLELLPSLQTFNAGQVQQSTITYLGDNQKNEREVRKQHYSSLNAREAGSFGLNKTITEYVPYTGNSGAKNQQSSTNRINSDRKEHHLSEMTVLQADGMRYIYGIPAYNKIQKEVMFNTSENNTDWCVQQSEYEAGVDNSMNNIRGKDNLFRSTDLPPYAHSYLLTSVISDDYIDKTGNGVSDDDLGTYVKIDYSKVHDNFKWRTPFSKGNPATNGFPKASYNPVMRSIDHDDIGSYAYGEKEVWYVHSIETKIKLLNFTLAAGRMALE